MGVPTPPLKKRASRESEVNGVGPHQHPSSPLQPPNSCHLCQLHAPRAPAPARAWPHTCLCLQEAAAPAHTLPQHIPQALNSLYLGPPRPSPSPSWRQSEGPGARVAHRGLPQFLGWARSPGWVGGWGPANPAQHLLTGPASVTPFVATALLRSPFLCVGPAGRLELSLHCLG